MAEHCYHGVRACEALLVRISVCFLGDVLDMGSLQACGSIPFSHIDIDVCSDCAERRTC